MRILYYSTSFYANHGGSVQSIEFFNNLKEKKHLDAFIFPDPSHNDQIIKGKPESRFKRFLKGSSIFQVLSFYRRNSFYFEKLLERLKELEPDILIIQMDSNFLQIPKIKNEFPDLMICTQINGSPFDEFFNNIGLKKYFVDLQKKTYSKTDLNFFISEFSRRRVMGNFMNPERDKIVYNGTDINKFFPLPDKSKIREKLSYHKDKFIIGYIGTLDFHKKMIRLAEAFKEVSRSFSSAELVIIGDGPAYGKLKSYIDNNGLSDRVFLKGWISHYEVNEHLNCFDLAIHHYANHYMNPLKIFEYLAVGLPVIAPDIESVRSLFKDGEDLLISKHDNKNLADEISLIIENDELRNKLKENSGAINKIAGNYTWENYTLNILNNIKSKLGPLANGETS